MYKNTNNTTNSPDKERTNKTTIPLSVRDCKQDSFVILSSDAPEDSVFLGTTIDNKNRYCAVFTRVIDEQEYNDDILDDFQRDSYMYDEYTYKDVDIKDVLEMMERQ